MTNKIIQLSPLLINQIAAGEVIENPASVVKELVENSLDAGAQSITVEIEEGGRSRITVIDDGEGMSEEDACLCFKKHATSKVAAFEDLFSLQTMGFRGEALASIAAVSEVTLKTRQKSDEKGFLLKITGDLIQEKLHCPLAQGTRIDVENLFYNVPARKAFQKPYAYDRQAIIKTLNTFALAYPERTFYLKSDSKKIDTFTGYHERSFHFSLGKRIRQILGDHFLSSLIEVDETYQNISLKGFIGKPPESRASRSSQYLFLNKRVISASAIEKAVLIGYGTALPERRFPFFVLHLEVPSDKVDINVHPQKKFVRFQEGSKIENAITHMVFEALQKVIVRQQVIRTQVSPQDFIVPKVNLARAPIDIPQAKPLEETQVEEPLVKKSIVGIEVKERLVATITGYILVESAEGELKVIDQRKAHARILFENLEKTTTCFSTDLLLPEVLEYSLSEAELITSQMEFLEKSGFKLEEFGKRTFLLRATPHFWNVKDTQSALLELVSGGGVLDEQRRKTIANQVAAQALPNNKRLTNQEALYLLDSLRECRWPDLSPKGEPLTLTLGAEMIQYLMEKKQNV